MDDLPKIAEDPDRAPRAQNDLELLGRFRQLADRDALGQLFQRHAGAAYRIARRFLKDPHEAEDAVQAAFLNVMQHAHQFQGRSEVKTWLISTVVNVCRTKFRADQRRANREQLAAGSVTTDSPPKISTAELYEAALKHIEELPEEYRLPLWMHYCEGLSFSDIAEALVISEPAARRQTHRGLELVRGSLAAAGVAAGATALTACLSAAPAEAAPAA
jgi:RNA polymerase sigma-70 factor (ECF subfamily)